MNQSRFAWLFLLLAVTGMAIACSAPAAEPDDAEITSLIKGKFVSEPDIPTPSGIDVNTTNGVVTLAGRVSSENLKRQVEAVVRTVKGVRSVNNHLQVDQG